MVTYADLKDGRILKGGDELLLYGIRYRVDSSEARIFLRNMTRTFNNQVFTEVFRMSLEAKMQWAKQYGSTGAGDFPEFNNYADLTNFVIALYETSPYKVGDHVKIETRVGDGNDYPAYFADGMCKYSGDILRIAALNRKGSEWSKYPKYRYTDGSIFEYVMEGVDGYVWHSSMFKLCDVSEISVAGEPGIAADTVRTSDSALHNAAKVFLGSGSVSSSDTELSPKPSTDIVTLPPKEDIKIKL